MAKVRILLIEDRPRWQKILRMHITSAVPEAEVCLAVDYEEGEQRLQAEGWTLVITDIGLPPASDHVLGMQLVAQAHAKPVPCIVVSGTKSVTKQHVRDLLRDKDYLAADFIDKAELRSPEKQREFREKMQRLVAAASKSETVNNTVGNTSPDRQPETSLPAEQRTVYVGWKGSGIYLRSNGLPDHPIPKGPWTTVFLLFARSIADGISNRVVENKVLNEALGLPRSENTHQGLRDVILDLRTGFRGWAGMKNQLWIRSNKQEHGYYLEPIVQWAVEPGQEADFREPARIYLLLVDPQKLQSNTPNRD